MSDLLGDVAQIAKRSLSKVQDCRTNLDELGPAEGQRYLKIVGTLPSTERGGSDALGWLASYDTSLLERVFECI